MKKMFKAEAEKFVRNLSARQCRAMLIHALTVHLECYCDGLEDPVTPELLQDRLSVWLEETGNAAEEVRRG